MDVLPKIFAHQKELMERFHHIELANLPELRHPSYTLPLNLDHMRAQLRLKEYAGRITEELVESKLTTEIAKAREEVIDALHFLVELFIMLGLEAEFFDEDPEPYFFTGDGFGSVMAKLWGAMNMLRFRPWKQTAVATDRDKFLVQIKSLWFRFADVFVELDMSTEEVLGIYLGKNAINHTRIMTGV